MSGLGPGGALPSTVPLAFPWLVLQVLLPLVAAGLAARARPREARRILLGTAALGVALSLGAVIDLGHRPEARDLLDPAALFGSAPLLVIDRLSRLVLPLAAVVFFVVAFVRPRTEARPGAAVRLLLAQATVLMSFCCRHDIVLAVLWAASALLLHRALGNQGEPSHLRGPRLYMAASIGLFFLAVGIRRLWPDPVRGGAIATGLILLAVLIRKGIFPVHSWMPVVFERAPLPEAILFNAPQLGAYVALRLIVPAAPPTVLTTMVVLSLLTGIYGAGLALVQKDGRRAFGCLFMSQSALTLAGLGASSLTAVVGGVAIWISSSAALTGLGMALSVLEARRGHLSLLRFHGGHESMPWLAACFALLGLCAVGCPGTFGFVASELLVDGTVTARAWVGIAVVLATVPNGIGVVRMYFTLFCGARRPENPALRLKPREHIAFSALVAVLVLGGIHPRPAVAALHTAAAQILGARRATAASVGVGSGARRANQS